MHVVRRGLRWLLLIMDVSGIVYVFTHDTGLWVKILIPTAAVFAFLSAVGLGFNVGGDTVRGPGGQRVTRPLRTLDIYFPVALLMTVVAVSLYFWA